MSTKTTPHRRQPLAAEPTTNGNAPAPVELSPEAHDLVPAKPDRRRQRFAEGLRSLKVGGGSLRLGERTLMVVGGIVAPLGLIIVLLGWWGASQTPYVFEQVPYLISGGLLGVGLVFLGAFLYFTHWLTELVKEHRSQSAAVVEAVQRLQDEVARLGATAGTSQLVLPDNGHLDDGVLVATARGTMAHRPDCIVVAGKEDLRRVSVDDGLQVCKLCEASADGA